MIQAKELTTLEDFENLEKGNILACEFHRDVHDHPRTYRFNVFNIYLNKKESTEIILQKKNNLYFNYKMFLDGESNLKSCKLITHVDHTA